MTGACLGEGDYSARFVTRPTPVGRRRVLGEYATAGGSFERLLCSTTDASADFDLRSDEDDQCLQVLRAAVLNPWRVEMELYRITEEGSSGELAWAGPVIDGSSDPDGASATVVASDLSAWWGKRLVPPQTHRQVDLSDIFTAYVRSCFAADNPGIVVEATTTGILGDGTIDALDATMLDTALEALSRTGVDWTVANRTFYVGGREISVVGVLEGGLVDEHFRKAPKTRCSGAGQVNDAYVRGSDVVGHHGGADEGDGVLLQGVTDENTVETQAHADAAAATQWDRSHNPLVYLEGSNALDPAAPVLLEQLIPGLLAPLDVGRGGIVPLIQTLRLESVTVSWGTDGEDVTVAFQPPGTVEA